MKLIEFIEKAVSPYHTVDAVKTELEKAGYEELFLKDEWELERGKTYMVAPYRTSLFAFSIGENFQKEDGFRITAAHGDFPGFRIKPNPEMNKEGYLQLNMEVYGGLNMHSWMDRPLSAAGAVILRSTDPFCPEFRMVDLKTPFLIIPSLAIHLNREVNKGVEIRAQKEMIPIAGIGAKDKEKGWFLDYLAKEMQVEASDILDYDLQVYNADKPAVVGMNGEFISAPRLDNLTSVCGMANALKVSKRDRGINLIATFDHEEIGSRSKQGADSVLFAHVMEKIYASLGYTSMDYQNGLASSMLLSLDVSQGYHPSYGEKFDPTNHCVLGAGLTIKQSNRQNYVTDTEGISIVKQLCEQGQVSYQNYLNHSDIVGGSTLGVLAMKNVPVKGADIGVPLLSMHAARELICGADQESMEGMLRAYFSL